MMKIRTGMVIVILIAAVSFLAGYGLTLINGGKKADERKVLYYVDPMNPAFKSDQPGLAPCGMPLEPVYAEGDGSAGPGAGLQATMPPGTIRITPEKQQLIGVRTMTVEKAPWSHTIRVLGRVAPDETKIYRINAAVNGWIEEVKPVTTGDLVRKNALLATFYSLEYRSLVQNYFSTLSLYSSGTSEEQMKDHSGQYTVNQLRQLRILSRGTGEVSGSYQIDYYRQNLYSFGISEYQVKEMERTRKIPDFVDIRAPAAGFILYRNVTPGLRFDRGAEFFRIADLSRIWILADTFENEASFFKPGTQVRIDLPYHKKSLPARVSDVLPLFDPATRTLKVRLVAANPGYVMRPDMFVNVELAVSGPPAITVPLDAVLDSGLRKTVFVDRGNGYFEPRQVETGRSLGERVEVVRGLMPGEKIVVSGNFLIDSEARLQQAASGILGKVGRDPVCGMNIDEDRAKAEKNTREYQGRTFYFCSPECRDEFAKNPERYSKAAAAPAGLPASAARKPAKGHEAHGDMPVPAAAQSADERAPHADMAMPASRAAEDAHPAMEGMAMPPPQGTRPAAVARRGRRPSPGAGIPPPAAMPGGMTMPGPPGAPSVPAPGPGGAVSPPPGAPAMNLPPRMSPVPGGMSMPATPGTPSMPASPAVGGRPNAAPAPGGTIPTGPSVAPRLPSPAALGTAPPGSAAPESVRQPPAGNEREGDHD